MRCKAIFGPYFDLNMAENIAEMRLKLGNRRDCCTLKLLEFKEK